MPPPSPEPELLPWIRLRRTCTGPEPADSATAAPACGSWPAIRMPPPLPPTPTVWSNDWLNRILLSAIESAGAAAVVRDAAAVALREVAADVVGRDAVALAAVVDADAGARVEQAAVLADLVVVDVDVVVVRVDEVRVAREERRVADADARGRAALVVRDDVVADLEEARVAVHEDAGRLVGAR